MKTWIITAVALMGLTASTAHADGFFGPKCHGPYCNHKPMPFSGKTQTLPVYLAAPWYLYWPYDAHFLTPAPVYGAFYPPPMMGNYPSQPFFPMNTGMPPQQPMNAYGAPQPMNPYGAPGPYVPPPVGQ